MKRGIGTAGAIIVMALPFGSAAWAQGNTGGGRNIGLKVGIRTTYDTNNSRSSKASATARNLRQSDWRTTPTISVDISQPIGRHSLTLIGSLGYDFYAHNTRLNRERMDFASKLGLSLSRCNADITGNYSRNQSDLADYGSVGGAAVNFVKNVETTRSVDLSVGCGAILGFRPIAGVGYSRGSNSNALRQRNDRDSIHYMGGIGYSHPLIGNARIFIDKSQTRYDNQILLNGRQDGYDVISYGAGFDRSIGSQLKAALQISYVDVNSRDVTRADSSGVNWSADITYVPTSRLQLNGQFSRSIRSSLSVDSSYNVNTNYSIAANYALSPRTQLNASYSISPRRFIGAQGINGPIIGHDRVERMSAGASHALNQKMDFSLQAGRDRRSAPGNFYNYKNYTITAGLDFKF